MVISFKVLQIEKSCLILHLMMYQYIFRDEQGRGVTMACLDFL